jgi:flagellar biosynthesis/type III secretory pathway M-ring protein FliF/YscJ
MRQPWHLAGVSVATLFVLLMFRAMFRRQPAQKMNESKLERLDETVGGTPSAVPAPHAERFFEQPNTSLREELSQWIEDDPDAAANVLRSWIGQVK